MDPNLNLDFTKEFGEYHDFIGSKEATKVITKADRVHEFVSNAIGLSAYQMGNLGYEYGIVTLKNIRTKEKKVVSVYNAFGPMCSKNNYHTIAISKDLEENLHIQSTDWLKISRKIDEKSSILWECEHNKDSKFGQTWDYLGPRAEGTVAGFFKEHMQGRAEISLGNLQLSNIGLYKGHIRPPCGEAKFQELKARSKEAEGLIKLIFNRNVIEVDVYGGCQSHGSAFFLSNYFADKLKLGDKVIFENQFDAKDYTSLDNNYLHMFNVQEVPQLWELFKPSNDPLGIESASCLEYFSKNPLDLLNRPYLFEKLTAIFGDLYGDTVEYKSFLKILGLNKEFVKENLADKLLNHVDEMLKEIHKDRKHYNPELVEAFIKMGFHDLKNSNGDNLLHLILKNKKGSTEDFKKFPELFVEKNNQGQTPLHLACQKGDFYFLVLMGDKLKTLDVTQFADINGRNPFHYVFMKNETNMFKKLSALKSLLERFPEAIKWLEMVDNQKKKPMDYIEDAFDVLSIQMMFQDKEETKSELLGLKVITQEMREIIFNEIGMFLSKNEQIYSLLQGVIEKAKKLHELKEACADFSESDESDADMSDASDVSDSDSHES